MLFNSFIRQDWLASVSIISYADDAGLILEADSKMGIKRTTVRCNDLISGWGQSHGLILLATKAVELLHQGPRQPCARKMSTQGTRPPNIQLEAGQSNIET